MQKINWNENWNFVDAGSGRNVFSESEQGENITLPHDVVIYGERSREDINGNTTGFYHGHSCIYTKSFFVPKEDEGKTLLIEFEGIFMNSVVYINGAYVAKCPYGYTGFYVNIGKYINYGNENQIKVLVKTDMELTSRWYSGCGIYRNVNFYKGNPVHIVEDGLKIRTLKVEDEGITFEVTTELTMTIPGRKSGKLRTEIFDSEENLIECDEIPFHIFEKDNITLRQRIYSYKLKKWSTEEPNLYKVKVTIMEQNSSGNSLLDIAEDITGFRTLDLDTVHGLRINGETIKLRGACVHHDNGILGAASFVMAEERKVRKLKEAGFNAIRSAHNPISKGMLSACDKYGMLVIDEAFDVWNNNKSDHDYAYYFAEYWKSDLKAMIQKDYNHPSVFLYNIGNEIQEIGTPHGAEWNRMIAEYVRNLDNTRYVGNAINGMFIVMEHMEEILPDILSSGNETMPEGDVNDFMTILDKFMPELMKHDLVGNAMEESCSGVDICGYNYMDSRYEKDGSLYPNRIIVGSETNPDKIGKNWQTILKLPYVLGDFVWAGWDYLGESGVGKNDFEHRPSNGIYGPWPYYLSYVGDIDICGDRRPQSYYREIAFGLRKKPYIAVANPKNYGKIPARTNWSWTDTIDSWTWTGYEGKQIQVEVYSPGDEVELYLNDRFIGRKKIGEGAVYTNPEAGGLMYRAVFDLEYMPGTLRAISYSNGKKEEESKLVTAGDIAGLKIEVESMGNAALDGHKIVIKADKDTLVFVNLILVDKDEFQNMYDARKIEVKIEGEGILQGYGSGDPESLENFFDTKRTAFHGKTQAIIRSTGKQGVIKLTASVEGLEPITMEIEAK